MWAAAVAAWNWNTTLCWTGCENKIGMKEAGTSLHNKMHTVVALIISARHRLLLLIIIIISLR